MIADGDEKEFDKVVTKFTAHFRPVSNVVHERAMFERAVQGPAESVDEFLRRLHKIADQCEFGDNRDSRIRDRFMANLLDQQLTLELQLLPSPTLATAGTHARNYEQVRAQVAAQRQSHTSVSPSQLSAAAVTHSASHTQGASSTSSSSSGSGRCKWCGQQPSHARRDCPARGVECKSCGKTGHYAKVCLSKRDPQSGRRNAHSIQSQPASDGTASAASHATGLFLGGVSDDLCVSEVDSAWLREIHLGSTPVVFKVDTGADTSVISADTYARVDAST